MDRYFDFLRNPGPDAGYAELLLDLMTEAEVERFINSLPGQQSASIPPVFHPMLEGLGVSTPASIRAPSPPAAAPARRETPSFGPARQIMVVYSLCVLGTLVIGYATQRAGISEPQGETSGKPASAPIAAIVAPAAANADSEPVAFSDPIPATPTGSPSASFPVITVAWPRGADIYPITADGKVGASIAEARQGDSFLVSPAAQGLPTNKLLITQALTVRVTLAEKLTHFEGVSLLIDRDWVRPMDSTWSAGTQLLPIESVNARARPDLESPLVKTIQPGMVQRLKAAVNAANVNGNEQPRWAAIEDGSGGTWYCDADSYTPIKWRPTEPEGE